MRVRCLAARLSPRTSRPVICTHARAATACHPSFASEARQPASLNGKTESERNGRIAVLRTWLGSSCSDATLPAVYMYWDECMDDYERLRLEEPSYYVFRTEMHLLSSIVAPDLARMVLPGASIIEFGCGGPHKLVKILASLSTPRRCIANDIIESSVLHTIATVQDQFPAVSLGCCWTAFCCGRAPPSQFVRGRWPRSVETNVENFETGTFRLGGEQGERLGLFFGPTMCQYRGEAAAAVLRRLAATVGSGGQLLVTVDLKKERRVLEAAYQSELMARMHRTALACLMRGVARVDLEKLAYAGRYNEHQGRVEAAHEALEDVPIELVNGETFLWDKGLRKPIFVSNKYSMEEFAGLSEQAGLQVVKVWTDENAYIAAFLLKVS